MANVILGATISLDGFINNRSGSVAALYPDLETLRDTEPLRESIQNTGAVVTGRNSYAMAEDPDSLAEDYEYRVPIFVLTHQAPQRQPRGNERLSITLVTDGLESAIAQAKAAAGDKDVTIIGATSIARQVLKAGLADELHIDIMSMLLGSGLRLFENIETESFHLERTKVVELPGGNTHLRFRIVK